MVSTFHPVQSADEQITIGDPVANHQAYILGAHHQIQPIGVPGELYVGGAGVARGYLNRPELTEEKFVEHLHVPGQKMYKTGISPDGSPDGRIEYLGRIDHQVKIRGYRIEIGEVEAQRSIWKTFVKPQSSRGKTQTGPNNCMPIMSASLL